MEKVCLVGMGGAKKWNPAKVKIWENKRGETYFLMVDAAVFLITFFSVTWEDLYNRILFRSQIKSEKRTFLPIWVLAISILILFSCMENLTI